MSEIHSNFQPSQEHDGIQHGPFPPPELDHEPKTAGWIMDEAEGDPVVYQLLMLHDAMIPDRATRDISKETFNVNNKRLKAARIKYILGRSDDDKANDAGQD